MLMTATALIEAYNRAGGLQFAKAITELPQDNNHHKPMVYQDDTSVESVTKCLL